MNATVTLTAPAERLRPGVAPQHVNIYGRDGKFIRQARFRGTEAQARAWAEMQVLHDTDPRHAAMRAILRGE